MRLLSSANLILSSVAFLSLAAYADTENSSYYTVEGSRSAVIPLNATGNNHLNALDFESLSGIKSISLMQIRPSEKLFAQNAENRSAINADAGELDYSKGVIPFSKQVGAVDLGMANVPVLDQGQYGTCVTFAATGALDAQYKIGDYIDQQCSLALNLGFNNNYWNGAYYPSQIINPLKQYGFILKGRCFGKIYPNPTQRVSARSYSRMSNKTYSKKINFTYGASTKDVLNSLKVELNSGHRVVFATFLADNPGDAVSVNGFNVVVEGKHNTGGLWACKQPGNNTNYCPPPEQLNAGHEIVITGYDDKQQLLKIRNSWGSGIGDNGDYYMTYTFFNAMSVDYTVIK